MNPAESFEPHRRRLLGLAYRMLGSMADAEDAMALGRGDHAAIGEVIVKDGGTRERYAGDGR